MSAFVLTPAGLGLAKPIAASGASAVPHAPAVPARAVYRIVRDTSARFGAIVAVVVAHRTDLVSPPRVTLPSPGAKPRARAAARASLTPRHAVPAAAKRAASVVPFAVGVATPSEPPAQKYYSGLEGSALNADQKTFPSMAEVLS